ncbi:MAG: hypothetical protein ACRELB_22095 [Polyangiaceae bacterium]
MDIALYLSEAITGPLFRPRIPVVFVETKRPESELGEHVSQLKGYLDREGCSSGLLFNARSAVWLTSVGAGANAHLAPLDDMRDVEEHINVAEASAVAAVRLHGATFAAAAAGDFASLRSLIDAFGGDPWLTFVLSIKSGGALGRIQAHSLQKAEPNAVTYRIRGVSTRLPARLSREQFHSLISVVPL